MTHTPSVALNPWTTRIYFDDTDAGGVVYHGRYLSLFERARNDQFLEAGFDHLAHFKETGECFVVARIAIDYHNPAHLGDVVTIESSVHEISPVRATISQKMVCKEKHLSTLKVVLVWVGKSDAQSHQSGARKPKRMPKNVHGLLKEISPQ